MTIFYLTTLSDFVTIKPANPLLILGLKVGFTDDDLEKAYKLCRSKAHPDKKNSKYKYTLDEVKSAYEDLKSNNQALVWEYEVEITKIGLSIENSKNVYESLIGEFITFMEGCQFGHHNYVQMVFKTFSKNLEKINEEKIRLSKKLKLIELLISDFEEIPQLTEYLSHQKDSYDVRLVNLEEAAKGCQLALLFLSNPKFKKETATIGNDSQHVITSENQYDNKKTATSEESKELSDIQFTDKNPLTF